LVGGLALFCLALFMALAFESNRAADSLQLQLDVPAEQAADLATTEEIGTGSEDGLVREAPAETSDNAAVFTAEAAPLPASVITALEQASEEPLDVELSRLLDAIQQGFGESSIQIAPALRPYAYRLAGRMNIRPGAYRVRVAAPSESLAEARAQVLGRLFESAGVVSSRLTFVPRPGIHSLTANPA
jgi:hypothetical protein